MNGHKQSDLMAWIWVIAAFSLGAIVLIVRPWEFPVFGDIHKRFWFSQLWFFAVVAGCMRIVLLMFRIAKRYDEEVSPAPPSEPKTPAERRRNWLSVTIWMAAFVIPIWPSLWEDLSGLSPNPESWRTFLYVSFVLQFVATLLLPGTPRKGRVAPPGG